MLKAIIFDVDGTLAETEEWHRRAFNAAFSAAGLWWVWEADVYGDLLKVTGGKERIRHFMVTHKIADVSDAQVEALHRTKNRIYADFVQTGMIPLRPGMAALINEARAADLTLALATTTSMINVEALLGVAFGPEWRRLFPVVVSGEMVAMKKPAPEAYVIALRQLGLGAQEVVAIEDSRNGLLAATGAGLRTLCVRSQYCVDDDLGGAAAILDDGDDWTLARVNAAFVSLQCSDENSTVAS